MILTVTLNPALDVTYGVTELVAGATHRVNSVAMCAGGKGINVSRLLTALGCPVRATGLLGGRAGDQLAVLLAQSGVDLDFEPIGAESRRTVVVADGQTATGFWEPGPDVTAAEWSQFLTRYRRLLGGVNVVVLSGSLPPGVPTDAYAQLTTAAHTHRAAVVLDADGAALRAGLSAEPDVVKPNRGELAAATGRPIPDPAHAIEAARALRHGTRTAVVATLGPDGLVAATDEGDWQAAPAAPLVGNATGAGDACVAALAQGLLNAHAWPDVIADAVAYSAAAVVAPTAGAIDLGCARLIRNTVVVERV